MANFCSTFAEWYPDVLHSTTMIDRQKMRMIWMSLRSIYNDTGSADDLICVQPLQSYESMVDAESAVPAEYAPYMIKKTVELWATMEYAFSHGGTTMRINIIRKYKNPEFVDE